jgi:UDP-glucose 6-dehydrogenase
MFRNAALAVNAGLANEFKEICDVYDLDYIDVKDFFMQDKTLGTHWQVPGPDGKVGFGGTCLPKDLTHSSSLCYSSDSIMKTAIAANKIRRKDGKSNRQD